MTGEDIIEFIQINGLEKAKIAVIDGDSLWQSGRIIISNIEIEILNGEKVILIS